MRRPTAPLAVAIPALLALAALAGCASDDPVATAPAPGSPPRLTSLPDDTRPPSEGPAGTTTEPTTLDVPTSPIAPDTAGGPTPGAGETTGVLRVDGAQVPIAGTCSYGGSDITATARGQGDDGTWTVRFSATLEAAPRLEVEGPGPAGTSATTTVAVTFPATGALVQETATGRYEAAGGRFVAEGLATGTAADPAGGGVSGVEHVVLVEMGCAGG